MQLDSGLCNSHVQLCVALNVHRYVLCLNCISYLLFLYCSRKSTTNFLMGPLKNILFSSLVFLFVFSICGNKDDDFLGGETLLFRCIQVLPTPESAAEVTKFTISLTAPMFAFSLSPGFHFPLTQLIKGKNQQMTLVSQVSRLSINT